MATTEVSQAAEAERKAAIDARRALLSVLEDAQRERNDARREAKKNEAILMAMADGVFVTDAEARIQFINPSGSKIVGHTLEEIQGKTALEAFQICDDGKPIEDVNDLPVMRCMKEQEPITGSKTFAFTHADGTLVGVDVIATPLSAGEEMGAIVVFRDVSRARAVDRMKSEFISVASHQLRTPLTAMRWYTEFFLGGDLGELTDDQKGYISKIDESIDRMANLVQSLLNVSRIEEGRIAVHPKPTKLEKVVQAVIDEMMPLSQAKGIVVTKQVTCNEEVNVDPDLIFEVFKNFISNAVKYSPDGSAVEVHLSKQDDEFVSKVVDRGLGIPKAQQERIFTKFFRADNAISADPEGNGLGLYICKSIVESSKGRIGFTSTKEGTTFWFTLPASGMIAREGKRVGKEHPELYTD